MDIQPEQPRTMRRVKTSPSTKPVLDPPSNELPSKLAEDKQCMSRITHEHSAQQFGNGRNKFYLEFRCPLPRFRDSDVCVRCVNKHTKAQQDSRTYDHGKINEPIPDHSHIFGSLWYVEHVEKWGEPQSNTIIFAFEHQLEARGKYKVDLSSSLQEDMARPKKAESIEIVPEKPKRGRKAKQAVPIEEVAAVATDSSEEKKEAAAPKVRKRAAPRKKAEPTPYQHLANEQRLIYKEVTLPTHIEETMEEVDLADYEVQYVTLTTIQIEDTTYYIDKQKQKLFRRIRDKQVGEYVGRYDPSTQTIHTDILDSDDESED
jgi:hypothetical protein